MALSQIYLKTKKHVPVAVRCFLLMRAIQLVRGFSIIGKFNMWICAAMSAIYNEFHYKH